MSHIPACGTFALLTTAIAPYYPRSISGYVQSISATGAYTQSKLAGTIVGTIGAPSGGSVPINASLQGRLYSVPNNAARTRNVVASRVLPPIRAFSLSRD